MDPLKRTLIAAFAGVLCLVGAVNAAEEADRPPNTTPSRTEPPDQTPDSPRPAAKRSVPARAARQPATTPVAAQSAPASALKPIKTTPLSADANIPLPQDI